VSQTRTVTLYFNAGMLAETQKEAVRQDRSISWISQAAWKLAREEVKRMPPALSSGVNSAAAAIPADPRPAARGDA